MVEYIRHWTYIITHIILCLGVARSWFVLFIETVSLLAQNLHVFVVEVKVSRGIVPFAPIGDGHCRVWTLTNRPRGKFAWIIHTPFQITQPGGKTITPLYQ
jgi:hypothetical protein